MSLVSIFIKATLFQFWSQFLLLALGMKSATCHNSCILCKVHINERYTKSINITSLHALALFHSECFSCKYKLVGNFITIPINLFFKKKNLLNRSDLSKPLNYFQTVQMKRRIDNIRSWLQGSTIIQCSP